jgi:protein-disulfide isomerase
MFMSPTVAVLRVLSLLYFGLAAPAALESQAGSPFAGIGHDRGGDAAKVNIIEFGDFGCSYCAKFAVETYPQLDSAYIRTGRVHWKFVPFVTGNFRNSREAAEAAECASEQDAFWKMHDVLYARRKEWMASDQPRLTLLRYAKELHLDLAAFTRCATSPVTHQHILHNDILASTLSIRGTPTFFVNGRAIPGAIPFDVFRQVIDAAAR